MIGTRDADRREPVVRLEGVSASYGVTVRRPLDLTIDVGDRLWIDGRSGVGKTSLLYVIGALAPAASGRVTVTGRDVRSERVARRLRRRAVSFVLQDALLVEHWSVLDNIRAAVGADRVERVTRLLESWDIAHHGVSPRSLSGGERQRLAVACALVRESRLVVADEPTSSLDGPSREAVMQALAAVPPTTAVVVSSHDPEWAGWATRRLTLGAAV